MYIFFFLAVFHFIFMLNNISILPLYKPFSHYFAYYINETFSHNNLIFPSYTACVILYEFHRKW